MGNDLNNRAAANWGPLQIPNQIREQQNAINSVDQKQKPLVRAIASLIQAASADLYSSSEDRKYRYIVDLILDRVRDALNTQLSELSETQLEAVSKQNDAFLKSISTSTAEIVKKLDGVTLDEKQANGILDQFKDELDSAIESLKKQIQKSSSSNTKTSKPKTVKSEISTKKAVEDIKKQLAKQFKNDKSQVVKTTENKAFKSASKIALSKQLQILAKNQKLLNQSMSKRFEKTTKTISGGVERLNDKTSTGFFDLNDKLGSALSKINRQTKRITAGIIAGVVGAISVIANGITASVNAVFSGLKAISGGLFRLFKKPASVIGELLKSLIKTPGGMFAIGWIGGYIYQKWLKPLWDWLKPIRTTLGDWFGGKITFKDACGKIGDHLLSGLLTAWEGLKGIWENAKEPIKDFLATYFGYDKNQTFWQNVQNGIKILWSGEDGKGGLKGMISEGWNLHIEPALRTFFGVPPGKSWMDWFLDIELTSIPIWGAVTIRNVLVGLAGYLALNAGVKVLDMARKFGQAVKVVTGFGKKIVGFGQSVAGFGKNMVNGIRNLGNPVRKAADLAKKSKDAAKAAAEAQKLGKAKDAAKFQKRAADYAKQTRDLATKAKGTKNAAAIGKSAQEATLAQGRATRSAKLAKPPSPTPKPTGPTPTTAKSFMRTGAKIAGHGLLAVDVAMDVSSAIDAAKNGDYGEAAARTGFGAAKAATAFAGPAAPIAYAAIAGAEIFEAKIKASTAEFDAAVHEMNARTQDELASLKAIHAQRKIDEASMSQLDKLLAKYAKFDQTKAEFDPLKRQRDEISRQLREAQNSTFSWLKGRKIRELLEKEDNLTRQLREIAAKSGLSWNELERDKVDIINSRESEHLLGDMSPEMKARFTQIIAEHTRIGPDNIKFLPDMQKVLEQLKNEYEGDNIGEKVDQVGTGIGDLQAQQLFVSEKLDFVINWLKRDRSDNRSMTIINAPQVQPENPMTNRDK